MWRERDYFVVEEQREFHPNVITARIIAGENKYYVVGFYCPPPREDRVEAWERVKEAWRQCPRGFSPLLMGDLNLDIDHPANQMERDIVADIDEMLLEPAEEHFFRRRGKGTFGTWTWRQKANDVWRSRRIDYILLRKEDRKKIKKTRLCLPRHHQSDHRAIVMSLAAGSAVSTKAYVRQLRRFPLQREEEEHNDLDKIYLKLVEYCGPLPKRKRAAYKWISEESWKILDRKNSVPPGIRHQRRRRQLEREFYRSLKIDKIKRAVDTGECLKEFMKSNDWHEAFQRAEGWYRDARDVPPTPCPESVEEQTKEREKLYARQEDLPGPSIPCNVNPYDVQDDVPEDAEIRSIVQ